MGAYRPARMLRESHGTSPTIPCMVCSKTSHGGKPWCSNHLSFDPNVQRIQATLASSLKNLVIQKPDPHGLLSRDMLCYLSQEDPHAMTIGEMIRKVKATLVASGLPSMRHEANEPIVQNHLTVQRRMGYVLIDKELIRLTKEGLKWLFGEKRTPLS